MIANEFDLEKRINEIGNSELKGCCDEYFHLRRVRSCLNGRTTKHVWKARFFGGDWCESESLETAIFLAVKDIKDKYEYAYRE